MPLSAGTRLGPYEILAPIGAGGMGEVYRARDTALKRDVALKVLPATFLRDPERMARFQREAEVLASLDHPSIGHIYGIVDVEDSRGLVLALIEGPTLADRIQAGPLKLDEAVAIAKQIIEALEYAHERGVVHRDLKPANIKITSEGVVKVLDFGLAKVLEDEPPSSTPASSPTLTLRHTRAGMILGTAAYMSPEQAVGRPVDRRSDIFSFGALLYEVLTGQRAFAGATTPDVLESVVKSDPDWSKLPAGTPEYLRRLLKRTLAKDRKQRLQAIGEARIALENPVQEPAETAPLALNRASRSRLGMGIWIAAAALLAIATALAVWSPWRKAPRSDFPLIRLDVSLGPDAIAGADSEVAISPDGTRIVFPIRGPDGKPLLATRLLDQAAITALPGTENGRGVFFSPDGQWIGFVADSKLQKVSPRGGAPVTLSDAGNFNGASWGENGDIVVNLAGVGGLQSIPASGGSPHALTNPGEGELAHIMPQILPGGNGVLFTVVTSSALLETESMGVVSLKTGVVKALLSGGARGRYLATNGSDGDLAFLRQGVLYVVAFDPIRLEARGSPEPILEDMASTQFDVSQTGTFVYHSGIATDQKWPVILMDSSGNTEPLVATPGAYSWPQFSPDGKRLALEVATGKGQEILIYDRQRDALSRLTFAGGSGPVWSRDGEHLVFASVSAAGSRLNWVRADGSGEVQVLLESKNVVRATGFAPDGRRLAYGEVKPGSGIDVWTLPLDTTDPELPKSGKPAPFLQGPASNGWQVFSGDGHYVAYFSNESGVNEVYVRPAPGPDGKPGPGKWQISTGGGLFPAWSENGRELFYLGLDNRIMIADYNATTGSFSSSKPRVWSDRQIRKIGLGTSFALAPDGKHVALFPPPEPTAGDKGAAHVTFLLNFFDELRRKVPVGK